MKPALCIVALTASAGCFSAAKETAQLRAELEQRAAFDLACDAEALKFTELGRWSNDVVNEWGVEGCGKRATYLRAQGAWVQNATDTE